MDRSRHWTRSSNLLLFGILCIICFFFFLVCLFLFTFCLHVRLILSDTPADSPSPLEACLRFYQTRLTPVGRRVGVQTRLIWPVRRVTSCWQAKACGVACLVGPQPASASAGWHASGMWQRHWITSEKHRTGWRNFQNSKNIHLAEAVLVKLKKCLRLTPLQAEAEACDW